MPSFSETVAALAKLHAMPPLAAEATSAGLTEVTDFGRNPGALRGWAAVPEGIAPGAALVVVLHGCTQTAAGYDAGSGWSELAERHGFALLFPEQQRQNNPNLCFNWFSPVDQRRDSGEALSIREMIAAMVVRHGIDPARIFVTGLSAGGAMAAVMLAAYPEVFAGGAIIAGLPYGCAGTVPQALEVMRGHGLPDPAALTGLVRAASPHRGPWPTLSVWQGSADTTVDPVNAGALVSQWAGLHGVERTPARTETIDGYPRRRWHDAAGRPVIEAYSITGLGHGTPLATGGVDGYGRSGPFMLEAAISSTRRIAAFWGLIDHATASAHRPTPVLAQVAHAARPSPAAVTAKNGVAKVIEDALRAAGLMR